MLNLDKLDELVSFKPILQELKSSKKEFIKINLQESKTLLWESKVGGDPYLLDLKDYPKNYKGECLRLLAQINFEEVPNLKDFPTSGILQFFILADDIYGFDFNNPTKQDNFRVIYIKDIIKDENELVKDFSFLPRFEEDWYMPIEKECAMNFSKECAIISLNDYKMQKLLDTLNIKPSKNNSFDDDVDRYYEEFNGFGHKIGGYPDFTQTDPRFYGDYQDFDTLLFQLDSDDENGIIWGDVGIANFFIDHKRLKELDFSEVLYNWDCH